MGRGAATLISLALAIVSAPEARAADPKHSAIILLLDTSASLRQTDPLDLRAEAARLFIDTAPDGDRLQLMGFAGAPEVGASFRDVSPASRQELRNELGQMGRNGAHTDHVAALEAALAALSSQSREFREQYRLGVVLFTDGLLDPDPSRHSVDTARGKLPGLLEGLRNAGAQVFGVSLGSADPSLLRECADRTGGAVLLAQQPGDLLRAFNGLRQRLSESYAFLDARAVMTPLAVDVPSWANQVSLVLLSPSGRLGCTPTVEGSGGCVSSMGTAYAAFHCVSASAAKWNLTGTCRGDVLASATGDVHLDVEVSPEEAVVGEPVRISLTPRGGREVLRGLPFLADAVARAAIQGEREEALPLYDDGASGDARAGDGTYSRFWRPAQPMAASIAGQMVGTSFDLRATAIQITVHPSPLRVEAPDVTCFAGDKCSGAILVTNVLRRPLTLKTMPELEVPAVEVPPGERLEVALRHIAPPVGSSEERRISVDVDGFEKPIELLVKIRRLHWWETMVHFWYVSTPLLALVFGFAYVLLRPAPMLSGTLDVQITRADGSAGGSLVVGLAPERSRRISSEKLGLGTGFALERRKIFPWGAQLLLIPGEEEVQVVAHGVRVPLKTPRELRSGDQIACRNGEQKLSITYRS